MNEVELASIRFDYFSALGDYGISHEDAHRQSVCEDDFINKDFDGVVVKRSEIHGNGLFATRDISKDAFVCIARFNGSRTIAGRYTNHSPSPNAIFIFHGESIVLFSTKDIKEGEEVLVDYRDSLSLQLSRPGSADCLVASNGDISKIVNGRCFLTNVDASSYDLLFSEDHSAFMSSRDRVLAFEEILKKLPQLEIEPKHEFIEGLYKREITFPRGTLATGKIHPKDHMDVMLSGEMIVVADGGYKHLKGPCFLTSRAFKKKAGYALTDVTWATYHPTSCTTVEDVEKEIFVNDFNEIEADFNVKEAS